MSHPRIVNLGLPKTGTTTLATALEAAGLRVADGMIRDENGKRFGFVGRLMYKGYFESGDPLAYMPTFDAFTEVSVVRKGRNFWPQTDWALIDAIRTRYPGTRFLLSTRDTAKHADSIRRWSNLGTRRLPEAHVPGLPQWHGHRPGEIERWIEGHTRFCYRVFAGADDFLAFDIEDPEAKDKIAAFTGLELPWWGKVNVNENNKADHDGTGSPEKTEWEEAAIVTAANIAPPGTGGGGT